MNDDQKQILEAIAFWADLALEGAKGALKEGKADDYDLYTFKHAARAIKTLRRNYIAYDKWCKRAAEDNANNND